MSLNGKEKSSSSRSQEAGNEEIDLRELFFELYHHKGFILFIVFLCVFMALCYVLPIPPEYKTTALIQVENKQTGVEALQGLSLMNAGGGAATTSQVETALMRSRYILDPVIQQQHLDISIEPRYFPIIGAFMARRYNEGNIIIDQGVANAFLGLSQYAWGGEILDVKDFTVPDYLKDCRFLLIKKKDDQYSLYTASGQKILEGYTGEFISSNPRIVFGISIQVNEFRAHEGTTFYISKRSAVAVSQELLQRLIIRDVTQGKAELANVITGVLESSLKGVDEKKLPGILNSILAVEIQKNSEKKSQEIRQTLSFLQEQLQSIKLDLDRAETILTNYRSKTRTFGMSYEANMLLNQTVQVEQLLEQLRLRKAELLLSYTDRHPLLIVLTKQENQLKQKLNRLEAEMGKLPKTEQKAISLERNVRVKNSLYLMLLVKIQQLKVMQAGIISDIRVLGYATAPEKIHSMKPLILLGSVLFGFILAMMLVFLRKMCSHTIGDPDYIEDQLGLSIYAIVPFSKYQGKLTREMKRNIPGAGPFILADRFPKDLAIEGLRSLRTTLQFLLAESRNKIISITGSSPSIGKSFLSANLAYLLMEGGKRVLLIDADMRKGKIFRYWAKKNKPGLAELLDEKTEFKEAVQTIKSDQLDFISTGIYPHNPSELLLKDHLKQLLDKLSDRYDIILLDTPPILAVSDSILVCRQAGVNLMVIGSGKEHLKEVEHAVKRCKKNQIEINGLILNDVIQKRKAHGYYGYQYNYYYDYEAKGK